MTLEPLATVDLQAALPDAEPSKATEQATGEQSEMPSSISQITPPGGDFDPLTATHTWAYKRRSDPEKLGVEPNYSFS